RIEDPGVQDHRHRHRGGGHLRERRSHPQRSGASVLGQQRNRRVARRARARTGRRSRATKTMRHCILIVDDEYGLADLVSDLLEAAGYDTMVASNGLEGLQSIEQNKPDLVVMDVM